jgi:hypothetical protein
MGVPLSKKKGKMYPYEFYADGVFLLHKSGFGLSQGHTYYIHQGT